MTDTTGTLSGAVAETKRRSPLADSFTRLLKEKPLGTIGAIIVLIFFLTGIFAELLAPYAMGKMHLMDNLSPPSAKYILGTDELGRDMLSRIIFGARISMTIGLAGASLATLLSTVIGLTSGFIGGKFDLIMQRFVDGWMCFPGLFLILSVMAVLGPGLAQVILVVGLLTGVGGSRIVRGAVIGIKENMYVEASRAIGCSSSRILIRHILPNVMAPIIVLFTTRMAHMILLEATISFLGYGIPPPQPSWGGMLSETGCCWLPGWSYGPASP